MKKDMTFKIAAISAILIGMLVTISPVGAKGGTSYSFNFVGPNVTMHSGPRIYIEHVMDIEPGSYMIVTGAGTFDPSTGSVNGGGAFTHYNYDGTLYCKGIWKVKSFVSFDSGVLVIIAEWTREMSPIPGYPKMVIGRNFLEISKNGWTVWMDMDGDSIPDFPIFDVIVSGHVFFHQHG